MSKHFLLTLLAVIGMGAGACAAETSHEPGVALTPKSPDTPRINGATVVGVRPGSPLLYCIAATGVRPMTFSATDLPSGLTVDPATGFITGSLAAAGEHLVHLGASNAAGHTTRELHIIVGKCLALTPPMGWNSWNCFANAVSEQHIRDAADALVRSGLRDHGWTYINTDDFWSMKNDDPDATLHGVERDPSGAINANSHFPDMKGMTDYIHSLGLKAGIYSSPGPRTCGGCVASFGHEREDAARFAAWGFDYLKYDWCSYDRPAGVNWGYDPHRGAAYLQGPYKLMAGLLAAQPRDIVFSLCQYGWSDVWEWGGSVGGNSWRTTSDIRDNWDSLCSIGFSQAGHEAFAKPGNWNDPDMLVVGWVGWGQSMHPTGLTPDEQYTHISLWCLLSAPLLIGCDLTRLDDFTFGLLSNDEVLAVDQDPLGHQAHRVLVNGTTEVWSKPLEDGRQAVGLFNRGDAQAMVQVTWPDLGCSGSQPVRDLWRQKDLGAQANGFAAPVARHGCMLIAVGAAH